MGGKCDSRNYSKGVGRLRGEGGVKNEGFPRFPIKIRACRCSFFRWPIAVFDAAQDKVPVVAVLFAPGTGVPAVAVVAEGSNAMLP